MKSAQALPDEHHRLLTAVDRQLEYLTRLVQDLLDVARIEAGHLKISPVPLRLASAVDEALEDTAVTVEPETSISEDLWVLADRDGLRQLLTNLVSNAYRHGAPPVRVTAESMGDDVVVEVTDCGPGLSVDRREQVFQAFRAGEVPGSVGLGLTIVRGLVEAHGGTVTYSPNEPQGSRFSITLPWAPSPHQAASNSNGRP